MGSERVCACVYVGGVARLLLDPRPPMRERETPPPSWGGHHRRWVVRCLGGGNSYELFLVFILSFGSLHLVCACVHVRMASLSRTVRGRERYLPRTLGVPVTLGGGEEGSVSDRAALHAWRGRGECASTCIVCCADGGGQAWAVVGRAGRTCVVRALSWCIMALRAGCVARGLTGRRCMMCRVGSRWGRVAAGRARRGRIRARV